MRPLELGRLVPSSGTVTRLYSLGGVGNGETFGDQALPVGNRTTMQSSLRAARCGIRLGGSLGVQGMKSEGGELALEDMSVRKHFLGLLCLEPFWVTNSFVNLKIIDLIP